MIHLSVRLAWHDNGWNGRICQLPHLNSSCVVHDHIRDARDDEKEIAAAGKHLAELNWLPPCSRDPGAWSPRGFRIVHRDPVGREGLLPVPEDIPAYTCTPAPYLWMREESVRDICDQENFVLEGPRNPDKQQGWVTEPVRQRELLKLFWSKITPGSSLVFYYLRPGVPVDEDARRVIVGVGRIAAIGPQLYFGNTNPTDDMYPIWSRAVSQNFPVEGVRLPYQEYLNAGHDPANIICRLPNGLIPYFSFVAEHVNDDIDVGVLERMIQCVTAVRDEGLVAGDWDARLVWLNDALAEVWAGRGPFPGIGSVLQYLGCRRGTAYQRLELPKVTASDQNPWEHVVAVLEGRASPVNPEYEPDFGNARRRWQVFNEARRDLLAMLARFELTEAQVERVANPDARQKAGILSTEAELLANPYLIYEQDLGTNESVPIDLDIIDHGMLPDGAAARFVPPTKTVVHDDARRVRAVATAVLRAAAEQGDTVLPLNQLLGQITAHFPDRRACRPDRDVFAAEADFHSDTLWLDFDHAPQLVGLQMLRTHEQQIVQRIKRSIRRTNPEPEPPIDWTQAIRQGLQPTTEQHHAAVPTQAEALAKIYRQRLSVLIGGAGTGKTSVLKIFLNQVATPGERPLLLAPTGKARVRLSATTERNAMTIHQFLLRQKWLRVDPFSLRTEGGEQGGASVVVIDECSMIPTDLFGALFKALDFNKIKWLVLVGDPNQLPPIGPGRPFVDIVAWLRENGLANLAELKVTTRVVQDTAGVRQSDALALADGYRSDINNPGDDTILAQLALGQAGSDIEAHFWQDHHDLQQKLQQTLAAHLQLDLDSDNPDYKVLNESFGIGEKPWQQDNFAQVERWQLLSPVRGQPYGTDELNRTIQLTYKGQLIRAANNQPRWAKRKKPRPFGNQAIVYTDKVIQIMNHGRRAY
ncbi:MAG: AAA family ATPase, partial [Anaerolineales bacterium]|nr:AAA family ATPase [Anaerolineales bacterium]